MKYLCLLILAMQLLACIQDEAGNTVSVQGSGISNALPPSAKLDFLFVIDNSGSMCEEQERLVKNFTLFSNFIFEELKEVADYRIAITSTDIGSVKQTTGNPNGRGGFIYAPARSDESICKIGNQDIFPNTADCPAIGSVSNVISSTEINAKSLEELIADLGQLANTCNGDRLCEEKFYRKAYLEKRFRCSATIGTNGYFIEKGLEAMRIALSCDGPNADQFGSCCQRDANANWVYNPLCEPTAEDIVNGLPSFLRPDAKLIVTFISDENDCSTPNDNPILTERLICRVGGTQDDNGNLIPDIYEITYQDEASVFYQLDCGSKDIGRCKEDICDLTYAQNIECEWLQSTLTNVSEYKSFLQGLKIKPEQQIIVASIVGFRAYTELGNELFYVKSRDYADDQCMPNPDDPTLRNPLSNTETCCPNGECKNIDLNLTCEIAQRKIGASAGARYLQLAEAFGKNGLGCNQYEEPDLVGDTYQRKHFCLQPKPACLNTNDCSEAISIILKCKDQSMCSLADSQALSLPSNEWTLDTMYGKCPARIELLNRNLPSDLYAEINYIGENGLATTYTSQSCISICDDLLEPLNVIKNKVTQLLSSYCLSNLPPCRISENGTERDCSEREAMEADRYANRMVVTRQCTSDLCTQQEAKRNLAYQTEWTLKLNTSESCKALIELVDIPTTGSELSIEFVANP